MLATCAALLVQPAIAAPKWDTNGDGKMTKDEFAKMAATRLVERTDADKDGKVSLEEWKSRPKSMKAEAEGRGDPAKRFAAVDKNSDGFVEAADLTSMLEQRFDRMDTNKDGVLTTEERKSFREARDK